MCIRYLVLLLWIFNSVFVSAQSPDDGKVLGNSYVNSFFRFSYTWPAMLKPYDTKSLNLSPKSPYDNEFLLFAAREGDEPFGVVVLAERLKAVTPHSKGIRDGADFLDRVERFRPEQHAVVKTRNHFTNTAGLTIDQLVYTENGAYSSAVAVPISGFLIVFKCNAKSSSDIEEMDKSMVAMRLMK